MAHFAKLGVNGKVILVVPFDDDRCLNADGIEDEEIGRQSLEAETGWPLWKQCSWNTHRGTHAEGKTPFRQNDAPASDLSESALRFEFKKFKYFCTEGVPKTRRETMWIEMLESIPAKEAELMDLVKDKIWPFKHITKDIASKAFPNAQLG